MDDHFEGQFVELNSAKIFALRNFSIRTNVYILASSFEKN